MVGAALRSLAVVAMLAAASAAPAQHEGHAAPAAKARPQLGASAAFDGAGRLWAVYREGGHVMLRASQDLGTSWTAPRAVNALPEPIAADGESRPKLAVGPGGQLHVTWTQPLAKPFTGFVRYARSADGGRTFSDPVTVHADRREITHRFDALALDGEGRVFIAWIDKRDREEAAGYRGAAVYFAVSHDGGASFGPDRRVAHHSCECCRIGIAPLRAGGVALMWRHVFEPNVRDHAWTRLHADGRVEEPRRATVDDWRLDACPHHGPSLAEDASGTLHAVWYTGAEGREGIHYGRLQAGGPQVVRRVGGETAAHADLAVSGTEVAIAWKEFDGRHATLHAMRSRDGGLTWREFLLGASAGATDQPRVLVHGGRFAVLWNTAAEPLRVKVLP